MAESRVLPGQTLLQVVKSFANERNEKSLTNIERYLQMAIEGFTSINLFELDSVEVAYLPVDPDTNVVSLPNDFIMLSKLGVDIRGRLWTLTMNNDLVIPRPESICPIPVEDVCNGVDTSELVDGGYYFAPHYRYGNYITTLYGIGGGFNEAYYRIDMSRRVIYLDGRIRCNEIILEYKSSGVKVGGALVPREAVPALKAYLHWKAIEYDHNIQMGEKDRKWRLYQNELYSLKLLGLSFTMDQYLDNLYESMSQTLKR